MEFYPAIIKMNVLYLAKRQLLNKDYIMDIAENIKLSKRTAQMMIYQTTSFKPP